MYFSLVPTPGYNISYLGNCGVDGEWELFHGAWTGFLLHFPTPYWSLSWSLTLLVSLPPPQARVGGSWGGGRCHPLPGSPQGEAAHCSRHSKSRCLGTRPDGLDGVEVREGESLSHLPLCCPGLTAPRHPGCLVAQLSHRLSRQPLLRLAVSWQV